MANRNVDVVTNQPTDLNLPLYESYRQSVSLYDLIIYRPRMLMYKLPLYGSVDGSKSFILQYNYGSLSSICGLSMVGGVVWW
jgi:hypothetical protein